MTRLLEACHTPSRQLKVTYSLAVTGCPGDCHTPGGQIKSPPPCGVHVQLAYIHFQELNPLMDYQCKILIDIYMLGSTALESDTFPAKFVLKRLAKIQFSM